MPIPKRDLRKCLINKFGFQKVAGSRHEAVSLLVGGRKVATTRFSRSYTELDDPILNMIARQIRVNLGYLKRMYDCTKDHADYVGHLRQAGHL